MADNPFATFAPQAAPTPQPVDNSTAGAANPFAAFTSQPTASPIQSDNQYAQSQEPGFLQSPAGKAVDALTGASRYMQNQKDISNSAMQGMKESGNSFLNTEPGVQGAMAALGTVGSAARYVTSPIEAGIKTYVEDPLDTSMGYKEHSGELSQQVTSLLPALMGGGEGTAPSATPAMSKAELKARDLVNKVLSTDGTSPQEVANRLEESQKTGLPLTAADVAQKEVNGVSVQGRNVLGILNAAVNKPGGAAAEAAELAARVPKRGDRINSMYDELLSSTSRNDIRNASEKQIQNEAGPAYEQSFSHSPVYNDNIKEALQNPDVVKGIPLGIRIQRNEAYGNGTQFKPYDDSVINYVGKVIHGEPPTEATAGTKNPWTGMYDKPPTEASSGTPDSMLFEANPLETPNMRLLDAAKKGLDSQINTETDPVTGKMTALGRSLVLVKNKFLQGVDEINPQYAAARQSYGDAASRTTAFERGRNFMKQDPEDIKAFLHGDEESGMEPASEAEKGAYMAGARRNMADVADKMNDSSNFGKQLWKQNYQKRMDAMFNSPEHTGAMGELMGHEQRMANTDAILGNSMTAPRLEYGKLLDESGKNKAAQYAANALNWVTSPGNSAKNLASDLMQGSVRKQAEGMTGDVAHHVTKYLLSKDPAKIRSLAEKQASTATEPPSWLGPATSASMMAAPEDGGQQ